MGVRFVFRYDFTWFFFSIELPLYSYFFISFFYKPVRQMCVITGIGAHLSPMMVRPKVAATGGLQRPNHKPAGIEHGAASPHVGSQVGLSVRGGASCNLHQGGICVPSCAHWMNMQTALFARLGVQWQWTHGNCSAVQVRCAGDA